MVVNLLLGYIFFEYVIEEEDAATNRQGVICNVIPHALLMKVLFF